MAPTAITVSCVYDSVAKKYTSGTQTFTVASKATGGGTPVTFDSTLPTWLAITPNAVSNPYPGNAAGATPVTFTATTVPQYCTGLPGSSVTQTVHVLNVLSHDPLRIFL